MDPEKVVIAVLSFLGGILTALLNRLLPSYKDLVDENSRLRDENEGLRDTRQDERDLEEDDRKR